MIRRLLRSIRPRTAAYFGARLLARGVDDTERVAAARALVLAPHSDDEAIGCGALIALKATAGTEVVIVIATDGRHSERSLRIGPDELARVRRIEAIEAATALGLSADAVRFLDFEDGSLPANRDQLSTAIAAIGAEMQPDEIFAPHVDEHPDHRTLSEVARATLAGSTNARYYEYPVRYWGRVPWVTRSASPLRAISEVILDPIREWRRPPAMLVRTAGHREAKHAALAAYAGEMESVGHFVYPFADLEYEAFFPVKR